MGMEIAQRLEGNRMVEEPYSDQTMGMEITVMMTTRREKKMRVHGREREKLIKNDSIML